MTVRVRFAPSPTGYLHIGGLRTALYNYLLARQTGGIFVLRIEDTDRKRLVEGSIENLIESLRWAGLEFDEGPDKEGDVGPYIQSQRLELYKTYATQLLDAGQAYYAFDTPEELSAMRKEQEAKKVASTFYDRKKMKNSLRLSEEEVNQWLADGKPHVIRMKVPDEPKEFIVNDTLRGEVVFKREHVDDQVLIKADGFPTYHMASVVDDHHMGITHIIRGEEWISSVPKHIVLYNFFGWDVPEMIHLPLILNQDRSKLSKRQNDVAVEDYREKGYNPKALINYMALLGWSPGDDRELFSMDELVETFSLERLNKSGAIFDVGKLNWFNAQYIRQAPKEELVAQAKPILTSAGFDLSAHDDDYLLGVVGLLQERMTVITEIAEMGNYFFQDPTSYDAKTCKKRWKETSGMLAKTYAMRLEELEVFDAETAESTLKTLADEKEVKAGALLLPARLSISGLGGGPSLFEMMALLGQETCIRRLRAAAETLG